MRKVQRPRNNNKLHIRVREVITKDKRLLALTMVLGSGSINQNRLEVLHKASAEEYLDWKIKLLEEAGIFVKKKFPVLNNGKFPSFKFYTKTYNYLTEIKRSFKNPVKDFSYFAKNLEDWMLAILYMDGGSISSTKKKAVLTINTGISKEGNQILIDAIKNKFAVSFGQKKMGKYYSLICGTKEARKFMGIVSPIVSQVSCMHYKLFVKNEGYIVNL